MDKAGPRVPVHCLCGVMVVGSWWVQVAGCSAVIDMVEVQVHGHSGGHVNDTLVQQCSECIEIKLQCILLSVCPAGWLVGTVESCTARGT